MPLTLFQRDNNFNLYIFGQLAKVHIGAQLNQIKLHKNLLRHSCHKHRRVVVVVVA